MKLDPEKYNNFRERLALKEHPLVVFYSDQEPIQGITPKGEGRGCIMTDIRCISKFG